MRVQDYKRRALTPSRGADTAIKINRRCPVCEAGPGNRCQRLTGLRYWKPMAAFHKER